LDWPQYDRVKESPSEVDELKANYLALVSLCDYLLGSILDYFDENNLWEDTTLVLTTDHGFMLGEHDWWAKNRMPLYNEIANIPLFIYHPDYKNKVAERRSVVTQNIDLMPTFLELNSKKIPKEVQGKSLLSFLEKEEKTNHTALFGYWGGGVNLADGNYTFFNYPDNMKRAEANQYTLMPTHLRQFFTLNELKTAKLNEPLAFTKGVPVLKIKNDEEGPAIGNEIGGKDSMKFEDKKTAVYDIINDPGQLNNIVNSEVKDTMLKEMQRKMIENDAPKEVLERFGF
jgi:arylsulfatase A-like enzyme